VKSTLIMLLATALAFVATSAAAQEAIGVLKRTKGDVAIQRGNVRIQAPKGSELQRGDRIVTSKNGYAYVQMRGAAPLAIGPETEVSLDRFAGDDQRVLHRSAPRLLQGLASYFALNRQR
jgi:hypothetical protein